MSQTELTPGTVWFADLDPTRGHEQAGDRPVLLVSSTFHLALTDSALVTVLPMTSRRRAGWAHHVQIGADSCVMTEQIRTLAIDRLRRRAAEFDPPEDDLAAVRRALAQMLDL